MIHKKRFAAGILALVVLAIVYLPGPRRQVSLDEARQQLLIDVVHKARRGGSPDRRSDGRAGLPKLGTRSLCSQAAGSFGVSASEALVKAWNSDLATFSQSEPAGCNYGTSALIFGLIDDDKHLGFYIGEKGIGPQWTAAVPSAHTQADWRSLLPALLAVLIAVGFRMVIPGLIAGILVGAMVGADGALGGATTGLLDALSSAFSSKWNLWILIFTLALIALVSVAEASGGIAGIIRKLTAKVKNRRDAECATVMLGGMLFFDDYANTMVVGSTMKPLTDRFGSSRAKLAYLVDSTAAPLAGIALLSTWIGYEVGLLQDLSKTLALGIDGYTLFLSAMPLRAYCLMALLLVFASAYTGRDLGPMIEAQRRGPPKETNETRKVQHSNPAAWRALLPLGLTFGLVFGGLLVKGGVKLGSGFDPWSLGGWRAIMGVEEAVIAGVTLDIASILALASLAGLLCAYLAGLQGKVAPAKLNVAIKTGLKGVSPAIAILLCAWVLSAINGQIGTQDILGAMVQGENAAIWFPALTFLLAAGTSFATGTSFGTMGILLPTLVPVAHALGGIDSTVLAIAAVMDGAIFGDHCSPLSDTTVMSSISTGCPLDEHVRTQIPYALLAMFAALLCCYIPAGFGWFGPLVALPLGAAAVLLTLRVFGKTG